MNALTQFWQQRNARERLLLVVVLSLLVVAVWYLFFWQPMVEREAQLERSIANKTEDLAWLQGAAQQLQGRPASAAAQGGNQSVLAITDLVVKNARLKPQMGDLTSVSSNTVRVSFDDAPYDNLLRFIYQLQNKYGVQVTQLVVDKQNEAGQIDARLTLQR